jgi:hypothetical protein
MIQFLEYGQKSGQTEVFAASVIKMFMQKIKAVSYVEAEAFAEFLPKLTQAMKPYLEKKEASFLHEMQIVLKEKFFPMLIDSRSRNFFLLFPLEFGITLMLFYIIYNLLFIFFQCFLDI